MNTYMLISILSLNTYPKKSHLFDPKVIDGKPVRIKRTCTIKWNKSKTTLVSPCTV